MKGDFIMKKGNKEILSTIKEKWNYYMAEFKNCLNDLKHKETVYKQIPNLLTVSRPIGMIPVNILFFTGNMVPGIILLGILLSTDFFDGKIARKYGIVSKFGADLDAICDKIMALGLMIPLVFSTPLLIFNILLEVIIASLNVMGRITGVDMKTLFSGKVKTWFLSLTLGLGYLVKFIPACSPMLIVSSIATLIAQIKTGLDYQKYIDTAKEMNILNNDNNEDKDIEYRLFDTKNQINELKREKEFLLSSKDKEKRKEKTKKRKK